MKWKKTFLGIFWLLLLLGFDQMTKYLVVMYLKNQDAVSLIRNVFEFQYLENHGAAFGVLQNQRALLLVITLVILVLLLIFYKKIPTEKKYFPLRFVGVLVAAGAIGNLIDRLIHGYVVDFLYFKLIDFPIFNVADCYVVIAAFMAFFLIGFYYKDEDFSFLKKEHRVDKDE